jgi:glycerophosphoryl diester phosphodiesterase
VNLHRSGDGRPLVIGHRGAASVAPENTLPSLQAAVDAGVDLVEFDVSPGLLLAHSAAEAAVEPLSLDDALEFLRAHEVTPHIDVKQPGYEREVVDAIRRHGLGEHALVSTAWLATARLVRSLAPELAVAIGYPHDRLGAARIPWPGAFQRTGAAALRAAMPVRVPLLLRQSRATVLALHRTLCSAAAVGAAHRARAPVFAWTVNDPAGVHRAVAAGVDGIVTDDPKMVLATLLAQ